MKKTIIFFILMILVLPAFSQRRYIPKTIYKQDPIICYRTNEKINIDGKANEKSWNSAKAYSFYSGTNFVFNNHRIPCSKTMVKCMYDNENFYVFFKGNDKDLTGYVTEIDGDTYKDDCFEVFFSPGLDCRWYYNLETNILNTQYTGKNHKGGGSDDTGIRWKNMWNPKVETSIYIDGTLNYPYDTDKYWCMEIKIPFNTIDEMKDKVIKKGEKWTVNFARYDYSIYIEELIGGYDMSQTSITYRDSFHEYQNWRVLLFD